MRKILGVILTGLSVMICLLCLRDLPRGARDVFSATGREAVFNTPAPPRGTISVNRGDAEDLTQLPGVGETLAQAILEERELHGDYHYPEDLMAAKGIGQSKLNGFRELLDMSEGE